MKRNLILTIIGASLALCPALHAQDAAPAPSTTGTDAATGPQAHHGGPAMMLQRLTTQLTLTTDQQAQVKPILDAEAAQFKANKEDTSLTQPDRMAKNKAARESANTQINALLTPDQQAKFATMQQHRNRHHGADAGGVPINPAASPSPSATP